MMSLGYLLQKKPTTSLNVMIAIQMYHILLIQTVLIMMVLVIVMGLRLTLNLGYIISSFIH